MGILRGSPRSLTVFALVFAFSLSLIVATGASAAEQVIRMRDFVFDPLSASVTAGDTITWTNEDAEAHTVTFVSGPDKPDSGDIAAGKTYVHKFEKLGSYTYTCVLHPGMDGTLTVQAAANAAPPVAGLPRSGEPVSLAGLAAIGLALLAGGGIILFRRPA